MASATSPVERQSCFHPVARQDTNTFDEPRKVIPITVKASQVNRSFEYTFVPYSVTVLEIKTK